MKNLAPIFLNCFSRGGSNILWNVFLSHPGVCSPIRETVEIFRLNLPFAGAEGLLAAFACRQWRLFDQWNLSPRKAIPGTGQRFIDGTFYRWKLKTLGDAEMKYKSETETYTLAEVQRARLVAKNNNGLVFLSDVLLQMYPDATFFALVRHPFALYESHKRRGISQSAPEFARFYQKMTERMIEDEARFSNYHIIKFESLLAKPVGSMKRIYAQAGLDFDQVEKIRFKAKPHLQSNGRHATEYSAGRHYWFAPETIGDFLEPNINDYQASRLAPGEKAELLRRTETNLVRLGYL